jgi:hypothetical protein
MSDQDGQPEQSDGESEEESGDQSEEESGDESEGEPEELRSEVQGLVEASNSSPLPAIGIALVVVGVIGLILIIVPLAIIYVLIGVGSSNSGSPQIGPGSPIPPALVSVFNAAGAALDVDPYLLASVARQESDFSVSDGVNSSGCAGFMQLGVGGACGDTWDARVTLTAHPSMTVVVKNAYKLGKRPANYPGKKAGHPNVNDPFDAVMAAAAWLRHKVGGKPIAMLDATAHQALCGYYGACADAVANYAQDVFDRASEWESESALAPALSGGAPDAQGYVSPFAGDGGIVAGRVDQGVDYGLSPGDPLRVIGGAEVKGVIQNWYKGEPLIWYQLKSGAYRGKYVYVAEQIDHLARPGQTLLPGQPIAVYAPSGTQIEIGWAQADGETLARATGGYAEGQSTAAGASFERLLQGLKAPVCGAAEGCVHKPIVGRLPAGYP